MGTLNTRGLVKTGKREEIETWMKHNNVRIMALQETHVKHNTRESREMYTWFFSGEKEGNGFIAGVAFVVANELLKYVLDIEPVTDRLCTLTLNYVMPVTLVNTYILQAMRPTVEKEETYKALAKQINTHKNQGPTYVLGDMNARVQKAMSREESKIIGQYTFEPDTANPLSRSEEVIENRQMLIEFCETHQLLLVNTLFKKTQTRESHTGRSA